MAFARKFTYDVFISYRQIDNQYGWITPLHKTLRSMLEGHARPKPGEDWSFSIFQDNQEIAGNASLSETIRQAVRSSALLLIVMSDNYLAEDSTWCHQERAHFLEACGSEARERLAIVRQSQVDFKSKTYPQELRDLIGYPFFETDEKTGVPMPMSFDFHESGRVPPTCQKLGNEIFATLNRLREQSNGAPAQSNGAKTPIATIFLAEVTDELFRDRGAFCSALAQEGIAVIPSRNKQYRVSPEAAKEELPGLLQSAALVVQLHGRTPIPSADEFGPGIEAWIQDEAKKNGKVPERTILRWRRRGMKKEEIADESHRAFVFAPDVIEEELEQFKLMVIKRVQEQVQSSQFNPGGGAKILVAAKQDKAHKKAAEQIADVIDSDGEEIIKMPIKSAIVLAGMPVAVKKCEDQHLPPKALMVVHADGDNEWADARMSECRVYQMNQMKKKSPKPPCAIVIDPAGNVPTDVPGGFDVIPLDDVQELRTFLAKIK